MTARPDDAIRQLRALYDLAGDAERPRCALLLGMAQGDHVLALADDTPGLAALAQDSLALLGEGRRAAADLGCIPRADALANALLALCARLDAGDREPWSIVTLENLRRLPDMLSRPGAGPGAQRAFLRLMGELMPAIATRRWADAQQRALEEIETWATAAFRTRPPDHAEAVAWRYVLAITHFVRCWLRNDSPRREDWPDLAEIEDLLGEVEAAIDAAGRMQGFGAPAAHAMGWVMVALIVMVIERSDEQPPSAGLSRRRLGLLRRAREQMTAMPPGSVPAYDETLAALRQREAHETAALARRQRPAGGAEPGPVDPALASVVARLVEQGLADAAKAFGARNPGGGFGLVNRPLGTASGDLDVLRAAIATLRTAARLTASAEREPAVTHAHATLGVCLAELYWRGETDPADISAPPTVLLLDAIDHLALAENEDGPAPSIARAEQFDVLARCYREAGRLRILARASEKAEPTALAALEEFGRCVLVAGSLEDGLAAAAPAQAVVARVAAWALEDNRPQAAVAAAEAGRSLLLTAVTFAGQVEEVLRGAGEAAAADAWRRGDATGLTEGLRALRATRVGAGLFGVSTIPMVQRALILAGADAAVYLLPSMVSDPAPAGAGRPPVPAVRQPARALVVRPVTVGRTVTDVLPLGDAETGPGSPAAAYQAAFTAAMDAYDPSRRVPVGFLGTSEGRAFADALDTVGRWAYDHVIGPLVRHAAAWGLDRVPHVVLVPVGELAAVPYPAAWAPDPALPRGRRYTAHDLVLTHAVSVRLLDQVARRLRMPLKRRVILAVDPNGDFAFSRKLARDVRARLFPEAVLYGAGSGSDGPATAERILEALPGETDDGASLLFLVTHGIADPVALAARGGDLDLGRILDRARGRRPDADGGLVVTSACITDTVLTGTGGAAQYDEAVTLATALLAAGAAAVVGTRWPIVDNTGSRFQHHLLGHLAEGTPPAQALRLAQLDMIDPVRDDPGMHHQLAGLDPDLVAHPTAWAGYVHHGI